MPGLKLSYVHGASEKPLIGETIGQFFDAVCEQMAVAAGAGRASPEGPAELMANCAQAVDRLAAGLLTLGLEPGDRIGIWSPNNSEWVLTQFATAKAGLILVNINPSYRIAELEYALNKVGCKALILAERFKTSDYVGILRELAPEFGQATPGKLESARLPALRSVVLLGDGWHPGVFVSPTFWRAALRRKPSASPNWRRNCNSTSRSTSSSPRAPPAFPRARRCRITISSTTATSSARRCGDAGRPVVHSGAALSLLRHGAGQSAAVTHGACMVFPGEGFDPLTTLQTVAEERCTALHGVPTMFIAAARPSGVWQVRSVDAAHRHHGRLAVPDRSDEARPSPR